MHEYDKQSASETIIQFEITLHLDISMTSGFVKKKRTTTTVIN